MSLKERFQRFVSRKSRSSGHSSSSSNSDACDPYTSSSGSSGTSTPTPTMPIATAPRPAISRSGGSKTSPTSTSFQNSLLSKTLTWRSSGESPRKERKRASDRRERDAQAARRKVHPSERPLTEANLRQQEALNAFKWEFGRSQGRRNSLGAWSVETGISPCCSRRPSLVPPPAA